MFDILALGEILLRLSPPMNEKLVRGETFEKQVGGAELNVLSERPYWGLEPELYQKSLRMILVNLREIEFDL